MNRKADMLAKYASNLPDDRYRNHYVSYARSFLESAAALDKESINKYLAKLKRQKKSAGTINFAFRVIRTLFNVNKLDWAFRRGEAPQIRQQDEYKPALDPELVKVMIEAAKNGKLGASPTCFLALSTVYGLRREELCDLEPSDVDLEADTIFISTIKFGRERYHLIPEEIKPYLRYDFSQRYSLTQMSQLFWVVVNGAGLQALKPQRLGWHSMRRGLIFLLHRSGLDPFTVHHFMRFKRAADRELAIDVRCHASHFVGLEGTRMVTEEPESDKEVFEKHPLLQFWR